MQKTQTQLDAALNAAKIAFLDVTICDRIVERQAYRFVTSEGFVGFLEMYTPEDAEITITVSNGEVEKYIGRRLSKQASSSRLREWGWFTVKAWDALSLVWGTQPQPNTLVEIDEASGKLCLTEFDMPVAFTQTLGQAVAQIRSAAAELRERAVDTEFHHIEVEVFLFGRRRYLNVTRSPNSPLVYLSNASRSEILFPETSIADTLKTLFKGWF